MVITMVMTALLSVACILSDVCTLLFVVEMIASNGPEFDPNLI